MILNNCDEKVDAPRQHAINIKFQWFLFDVETTDPDKTKFAESFFLFLIYTK